MKVSQITLTMVEHEGRRWLCGADGSILATYDGDLVGCDPETAIRSVRAAAEAQRRSAVLHAETKADSALRARWNDAYRRAAATACQGRIKLSEVGDAWARRIDGSRKAICNMINRGSNLKERKPREPRFGTWERMLDGAYQRSMHWNVGDQWDDYSTNLSSNIRKRFRNTDTREAGPRPDGRHEQEEGRSRHPERPGLQVLFDWR